MFLWRTREGKWTEFRHPSGDAMRLRVELHRDERGRPTGGVTLVVDDDARRFVVARDGREP